MTQFRPLILICAVAGLSACASPSYNVMQTDALGRQIMRGNMPHETLGEEVLRESLQRGGCLASGSANNRSNRCEGYRDLIAPPQWPDPEEDAADEDAPEPSDAPPLSRSIPVPPPTTDAAQAQAAGSGGW